MTILFGIIEKQFHELKEECISLCGYSRQLLELSNYPLMDKSLILNDLEIKKLKTINKKILLIFKELQVLKEKFEKL